MRSRLNSSGSPDVLSVQTATGFLRGGLVEVLPDPTRLTDDGSRRRRTFRFSEDTGSYLQERSIAIRSDDFI
jgi:hypothetical protein